jgi:hypothetical protein
MPPYGLVGTGASPLAISVQVWLSALVCTTYSRIRPLVLRVLGTQERPAKVCGCWNSMGRVLVWLRTSRRR